MADISRNSQRIMSDITDTEQRDSADSQLLSLRISSDLAEKINAGASATKLGRSAMLRLAIERGIDRLIEQLEVKQPASETTQACAEN